MKDKIKNALVKVLWAMNIPFFLVRTLMAIIPMIIGFWIAFDDTNDDYIHLMCCMLEALKISGLIGFLLSNCQYIWYNISLRDDVDYLEERLKKMLNK